MRWCAGATGASTRWSTAVSWPCGAGSSTSTRPPPISPCALTCSGTRWTGSPNSTRPISARSVTSGWWSCSDAGSCCRQTRCGAGPRRWWAPSPGVAAPGSASPTARSSTAWNRGCPGWSTTSTSSPTCSVRTPGWSSSTPAAAATGRAGRLLDEEAALAEALAVTWGVGDRAPERLHVAFDRLLARCPAAVLNLLPVAESPAIAAVVAQGWDPGLRRPGPVGGPALRGSSGCGVLGHGVRRGLRFSPAAVRWRNCWPRRGWPPRWSTPPTPNWASPGSGSWWRPSTAASSFPPCRSPCWPRPTSRVGAVPIAGPGRGPGPGTASSTSWLRATTSCTASTVWRATPGWSPGPSAGRRATISCSSTGAPTSSTSPPTRSRRSPPTAAARRRRSTGWAAPSGSAPGPRRAPRCSGWPRSWWSYTAVGSRSPAMPSHPTPRGSTSWRTRSPTRRPSTRFGPSRR